MAAALDLTLYGIDLADAIHFSGRPRGSIFVSFDQVLIRRAKRAGETEVLDAASKI